MLWNGDIKDFLQGKKKKERKKLYIFIKKSGSYHDLIMKEKNLVL